MFNDGAVSPSPRDPLHKPRLGRAARIFAGIVVVCWLGSLATPAAFASASQIVIHCTTPPPHSVNTNGCSSSELVSTPPIINAGTLYFVAGFWVWCQSPTNGTPYGPDCNGSMYVAEVDLATGTVKYEATSISGSSSVVGSTGLQVTFTSSDGDMTCTLGVPTSPTAGSTNQLSGTCGDPSNPSSVVPIVFSQAGANVTGS